ncbi:hypothetical protein SAMN06265349_1011156 [Flavobacterium resistens]|uniref:Outer membrane protein beta-barrel domain-containing protein n=1 Tax=Flavobacterium resistens TaxID=443612 RepID=A0A521BKT8_9FLAO|nr:hypothetical protein [Flavobacterium resistens]MRX67468.1 hypothetical protein [Flavobacterium resistens]SMO47709.1 hypothetical protein SAMN06265349_1011156 [Flavobacterium resistens]
MNQNVLHKIYFRKIFFSAFLVALISIFSNKIIAQENEEKAFSPHHQIGVSINHAHVFEGRDDEGNRKVLSLPAWGLDYTFQFHEKWAIGLYTDFIIEKFKVEKNLESGDEKETVERSYPIAPALMGIYKPNEHWSFLLGFGGEFAKEEDYFLTRVGAEYGYELPKDWEFFGTVSYDFKWNAYDSWGIGLGIAKNFGGK